MNKVRDIMTGGAECIGEQETVVMAARKMQQLDVGAMPICGTDDRLIGMLTDRDIVIKVLAAGKDPATTNAIDLAQGTPFLVDADASVEDAIQLMEQHKVRRLPVISDQKLIGMLSQGDIAKNIDQGKAGELLRAISAAA